MNNPASCSNNHLDSNMDKPFTLVLLVNLGSPSAPTARAVRAYLREFLSDRRVVETPRIIWWLILNLVILPLRSSPVARLYASVFTNNRAPLVAGTASLAQALSDKFNSSGDDGEFVINYAMRYGLPSITGQLNRYRDAQLARLVIVPLYPQYAASTAGSVFDQLARVAINWRRVPDIRFISSYHDYPPYLAALVERTKSLLKPDYYLIMSFHGLPQAMVEKGDPYYCHCYKTAHLLADLLKLEKQQWQLTFQSRFGNRPWLQPYTDKVLGGLPAQGITKVQVVCPGFAIDCLETLEEIAVTNKRVFLAAGGKSYSYIPCLNDSQLHVDMLRQLIVNNRLG